MNGSKKYSRRWKVRNVMLQSILVSDMCNYFSRSEAFLMRRKSQVELKDSFCSNKKEFVASLSGKPSILKAR